MPASGQDFNLLRFITGSYLRFLGRAYSDTIQNQIDRKPFLLSPVTFFQRLHIAHAAAGTKAIIHKKSVAATVVT
jgi:hypothetical protein